MVTAAAIRVDRCKFDCRNACILCSSWHKEKCLAHTKPSAQIILESRDFVHDPFWIELAIYYFGNIDLAPGYVRMEGNDSHPWSWIDLQHVTGVSHPCGTRLEYLADKCWFYGQRIATGNLCHDT